MCAHVPARSTGSLLWHSAINVHLEKAWKHPFCPFSPFEPCMLFIAAMLVERRVRGSALKNCQRNWDPLRPYEAWPSPRRKHGMGVMIPRLTWNWTQVLSVYQSSSRTSSNIVTVSAKAFRPSCSAFSANLSASGYPLEASSLAVRSANFAEPQKAEDRKRQERRDRNLWVYEFTDEFEESLVFEFIYVHREDPKRQK